MKKIAIITAAIAIAAISVASCSNTSPKKLMKKGLYDCSNRLQAAAQRMERKNYTDAVRIVDDVKYQCGGSPQIDTAYYYAAVSYFRQKLYDEASAEFEALYGEFPRSPFAEEAHFRFAHIRYIRSLPSFRDQAETKEAMRLLNDYTDLYPKGAYVDSARTLFIASLNKLAEKEFNNALFYRKQKEHNAALIYYRAVLSEYPESRFAPEAVVGMAEMLIALQRTQEAVEIIEELDASEFDEGLKGRIEVIKQRVLMTNAGNGRG
ncbi:MAG: outer membrane protein assembly factor BamD [Chitinispirillales bacterium]|jgi:outer membrane protein assembly factor BamD|nr:outer membrane protein assembly factor BamD [Chitinispirillales bacterium]